MYFKTLQDFKIINKIHRNKSLQFSSFIKAYKGSGHNHFINLIIMQLMLLL